MAAGFGLNRAQSDSHSPGVSLNLNHPQSMSYIRRRGQVLKAPRFRSQQQVRSVTFEEGKSKVRIQVRDPRSQGKGCEPRTEFHTDIVKVQVSIAVLCCSLLVSRGFSQKDRPFNLPRFEKPSNEKSRALKITEAKRCLLLSSAWIEFPTQQKCRSLTFARCCGLCAC